MTHVQHHHAKPPEGFRALPVERLRYLHVSGVAAGRVWAEQFPDGLVWCRRGGWLLAIDDAELRTVDVAVASSPWSIVRLAHDPVRSCVYFALAGERPVDELAAVELDDDHTPGEMGGDS